MPAGLITRDPFSDLNQEEQVLVMLLLEQLEPVGARLAQRLLADVEVQVSEASVSRMLLRLDAAGITRSIGRKGRVLTPDGKRLARNRAKQIERHEHFERALDLRSVDELLDYLRARRSLEGEAAYLAALRLDDEALARLDQCTEKQEASIRSGTLLEDGAGVDVHREMVAALDSPVFKAIIESLLSSLPNIERAMEMIMINRGAADAALHEHRAVVDAIRNREPELARTLMHRHFERLENDVRIYCNEQVITNLSRLEAQRL